MRETYNLILNNKNEFTISDNIKFSVDGAGRFYIKEKKYQYLKDQGYNVLFTLNINGVKIETSDTIISILKYLKEGQNDISLTATVSYKNDKICTVIKEV